MHFSLSTKILYHKIAKKKVFFIKTCYNYYGDSMVSNIKAIDILFENGESIELGKESLKDFCISNIDENANEIAYEQTLIPNKLFANFMLLNINNHNTELIKLNRLKEKMDIVEIMVILNNNKYLNFTLSSDANPFNNNYHNNYEYIYENDDSFGLLLSEYNIKYKENLFI